MLPDILNYIPDPKNGRPIADGQVFFFVGGYNAPSKAKDIDHTKIADVSYTTTSGEVIVNQPIFTSKGGVLRVRSEVNLPLLNVNPLTELVAVYDKCGDIVYRVGYRPGNQFAVVSEVAPFFNLTQGLRWYKPSEATTYIYFCDIDGCQWVQEPVAEAITKQLVTPEMFGAIGDGIADDTAAIQKAHDTGLPVWYTRVYALDGFVAVNNKPFVMMGGGTITFTQEYTGSLHKFELDGCKVNIDGISFNLNRKVDNLFSFIRCSSPSITNCLFEDSSSVPATTGLRHVLRFTYCQYARITGNAFNRIGDVDGGSGEVSGQYRCMAFGSGCGDHIVDGNTFFDSFQPTVTAEFDDWRSGKSYVAGNRVIFLTGGTLITEGQWGHYICIQNHTSGTITPSNAAFWSVVEFPIVPTRSGIFSNNMNRRIWDNSVYVTGASVDSYTITGNHWIDCRDEPIVIVGGNTTVTGNTFYNIRNKAIAIDTRDNDIESITIAGNTFKNQDGAFVGNFIAYRSTGETFTVKNLTISGNTFVQENSIGNSSCILIDKTDNLVFSGNSADIKANASERYIRIAGPVELGVISGNTLKTTSNEALFLSLDSPANANLTVSENRTNARWASNTPQSVPQLGYIQDTGSNIYIRNPLSKVLWGNDIPTTGQWTRGDIIYRQFPAAGGNVGWVCTFSGSPGTWKQFGTIEA